MAKLIQVIETSVVIGTGSGDDPMRTVIQHWSADGKLLAENDPIAPFYDRTDSTWIMPVWMKTKVGSPSTERMSRDGEMDNAI